MVETKRQVFQLLREGLKYPALHAPVRGNVRSPEYGQFRDVARALLVESHVRAARGDWRGAMESTLDGLEFGYDISRGGPLIAGLVSNAVQAISLREMYRITPHLDAKETILAAKRIEDLYADRFLYFRTLQEEKWAQQGKLMESVKNKFWGTKTVLELTYPARVIALLQWMDKSYSPPSWLDTAKEFLKYSKVLFISNKTFMKNYTHLMDAYIANGQRAYIKRQSIPNSGDPLTQLYASVLKDTRWNWARMDTSTVLKMTMFALRAYQLEKGHYPVNLKELVPQYLTKIPIDPFAGDAPLRYQLHGTKYLLWSIGADGIDNHGEPVVNRDKLDSVRYRLLYPDSKGDVVAGVNVP